MAAPEEAIEEAGQIGLGDATAFIHDNHASNTWLSLQRDIDRAPGRAVADSIVDEILEQGFQLTGNTLDL